MNICHWSVCLYTPISTTTNMLMTFWHSWQYPPPLFRWAVWQGNNALSEWPIDHRGSCVHSAINLSFKSFLETTLKSPLLIQYDKLARIPGAKVTQLASWKNPDKIRFILSKWSIFRIIEFLNHIRKYFGSFRHLKWSLSGIFITFWYVIIKYALT